MLEALPGIRGEPGGLFAPAADVGDEEEFCDGGVCEGCGDEVFGCVAVYGVGAEWSAFASGACVYFK